MANLAVLVGVGPFGDKVLERIEQSLAGEAGTIRAVRSPAAEVGERMVPVLDALLRAGRFEADTTERRLDVFVFMVATQGGDDDMRHVCAQVSALVYRRYGEMFDLTRPPNQRNASMHLVVWLPPLGDEVARTAFSRLYRLEQWAEQDPSAALLARIWLIPQMTRAGRTDALGITASAAAFALATLGSGLRDHDEVRAMLAHLPPGTGRFAFLSVASLDVPEASVRRYAALRAVYDGLTTLLGRVQGQRTIVADTALVAVDSLQHQRWLSPFDDGSETAQHVRAAAARLSGATAGLPPMLAVGAFDDAAHIRQQCAALFRAASVDRDLGRVDEQQVETVLRRLDLEESALVRDIHLRVRALFDQQLRERALRTLPELEIGLRHVAAQLEDRMTRQLGRLAESGAPPDPYREELERAVDALPSASLLRASAAAVGTALGALALPLAAGGGAAPQTAGAAATSAAPLPTATVVQATTAAQASPFPWHDLVPWGVAAVVAAVAAALWAWGASHFAREEVRRLLRLRLEAVRQLWRQGGGGRRGRQAEDQLELRRYRVQRVAAAAVQDAQARIQAVQASVADARDRVRQALADMGVPPTADASTDDLAPLLAPGDHLHASLVEPWVVAQWVRRGREVAGDDEWADKLLGAGWVREDAADDVPFGEPDVLERAGAAQVRGLARSSLLADRDARQAAADVVAAFVRRAVAALAPPVQPLKPDGTPVAGHRRVKLVLAPRMAQDVFAPALGESPLELTSLWVEQRATRVVFLYADEGFRVLEIGRGAGLVAQAPVAQ